MADPYLFAGDRNVAVESLRALLELDDVPRVLCVSDRPEASHADALVADFQHAGGRDVVRGSQLRSPETLARLRRLDLDVALSVHFPELVRPAALAVPRRGWLNLHPAFLPYNRGWHTPSWAILERTPAGATLHQMVEEVDAGAILARREVPIDPGDTAHSLYRRILAAEVELLRDVWLDLRADRNWEATSDPVTEGTLHRRAELLGDETRLLQLAEPTTTGEVIDRLRALTTDRWSEAARYEVNGRRYLVRVEIRRDEGHGA